MFRLSRWLSRSYRRAIEANIARTRRSDLSTAGRPRPSRSRPRSSRSPCRDPRPAVDGPSRRSLEDCIRAARPVVHVTAVNRSRRDARLGDRAGDFLSCPWRSPTAPIRTRRPTVLMGYRTLAECVADLRRHGQLVTIEAEIDPHLEAAAIQRRVYEAEGPAVLFRRVKGTPFPMLGNLFGTIDRTRFLFRDTLDAVRRLVELKVNPAAFFKHPWRYRGRPARGLAPAPAAGPRRARSWRTRRRSTGSRSSSRWPDDGGAVRHAAAGLHRGPRPARPGEVEPGDVPGPALGQRVRAEPRGRAALPDPPRDRRPPRGGDPPGRAAAGQRLRRRPPRPDRRRRDAAARRACPS